MPKRKLQKRRKNKASLNGEAFEPPYLEVGDVVSYYDEHGHHGPAKRKVRFKVIQVYQNRGRRYLFKILKKYRVGAKEYATILPLNNIKVFMRKN